MTVVIGGQNVVINTITGARQFCRLLKGPQQCLGHQTINVFHGGTLYQDIPFQYHFAPAVAHRGGVPSAHELIVVPGSLLGEISGAERLVVNSFHHQGIKRLAPGFVGVARRQELRGEAAGVRVIDDFAHHPTAIRQAVGGLRQRWNGARPQVLFEPRSNTTRRSVFQSELAEALAAADIAVVAGVPEIEKVPAGERLDPRRLVADIAKRGGNGRYLETVPEIVGQVAREARPGDVVAVFSNGGFGGIHPRLLERLAAAPGG